MPVPARNWKIWLCGAAVLLLAAAGLIVHAIHTGSVRATKQGIYREMLLAHHQRRDRSAVSNRVHLFGDSILQGLDESRLACPAYNWAIGGETAAELRGRIGEYRSLEGAAAIILQSGINDILQGRAERLEKDVSILAERLSRYGPLIMLPLVQADPGRLPPNAESIRRWNGRLASICAALPNCVMPSAPALEAYRPDLLEADGVHLDAAGYEGLVTALNNLLEARSCGADG